MKSRLASFCPYMIQYSPPKMWAILGRGATAAQQTLDLFILVRIRTPQLVGI